jgi:hypothetical protein
MLRLAGAWSQVGMDASHCRTSSHSSGSENTALRHTEWTAGRFLRCTTRIVCTTHSVEGATFLETIPSVPPGCLLPLVSRAGWRHRTHSLCLGFCRQVQQTFRPGAWFGVSTWQLCPARGLPVLRCCHADDRNMRTPDDYSDINWSSFCLLPSD